MMFGFGDSYNRSPETVRLIENIVFEQLVEIVKEAQKYGNGDEIKGEYLVFLLRHNKYKMRRFIRYLKNKHYANMYRTKNLKMSTDEVPEFKHNLLDFIESIDETGEFTNNSEVDNVLLERQIRADRISQALDGKKYIEFSTARHASFSVGHTNKDYERLKMWIAPDLEFNEDGMEVLAYLAYQTVAELIDYVWLIRMDQHCGKDPTNSLPTVSNVANKEQFNIYNNQCITVDEVREVMRRIHCPQSGYLSFNGRLPATRYLLAL